MLNLTALDQLHGWPPGKVASLTIETLAALARDLDELKAFAAAAEVRLAAGLDLRFGDRARQLRAADGKDTGRVRLEEGDFVVAADLTKRVEWDQAQLAAIARRIRAAGDDPAEYLRTTFEVSERAYGAWPQAIRRLFEPARTVKPGKPRYAIEPKTADAASSEAS